MKVYQCILQNQNQSNFLTPLNMKQIQHQIYQTCHVELDSDLRSAKHFNLKIWLLIIYVVIGWSWVIHF